jgi:ribulose-phosphate 3-epimerase
MIIPTILEKNKDEILNKINIIDGNVPHFQIDFVDPTLFSGDTYLETGYLNELDLRSSVELDLMVKNPVEYLDKKIKNVTKIMANINGQNISDFINISNDMAYITGISVNLDNVLEQYYTFVDDIDFIQFMGVLPGGQGRGFDKKVIENIVQFGEDFPDVPVQVDGGIKIENIKDLADSGVISLVIGSAMFDNENPVLEYNNLKQEFTKYVT